MMLPAIAASCLLLAIPPSLCSMASVEVLVPSKSAPTVRITTLYSGKSQRGVKIEIYRYELGPGDEAKPRFSLTSDEKGRVVPPKLAPGHYHVVASGEKNLRADLYLDVSAHANEKASMFSMELVAITDTRQELLTKAEQMPIRDRLREFRGIVYDPSGAVVSGVSIEVVRKGTQGRDRIARLKSGRSGQFSAQLSAGSYIAFFSLPGFQTQPVPFEVTEQGSSELIVTLQLGSTT